jgi:hypothetical protein
VNTEMKAADHDDNSQDIVLKKENTRLRMIVANVCKIVVHELISD